MERYERYKSSGVEWIGEMPAHWEVKRLKFNTYIKARVGWHGLRADEFSLTDGVFCVTGTDLQNGEVNWDNCYRVSEKRYAEDPYIQLRENDLLITKDGTIGKVAVVKNLNERATLNSGVFVVRPERKEYITSFMYWALQSPVFSEYVNYTSKGSTINHLYQETFFNLPFILPLPEEQTAIAYYLDEKTARIDKLIAKKQKLIELLKEERTAIINQAVTKGINPEVKLKPSGIDWLGDIPEHWEVKKLKYMARLKSGEGITADSIRDEGEYPVFGGNGLRGYTSSYSHEGDFVLIGRQGALCGNINYAKGKFWASEHAVVITPSARYNLVWLGELLRTMNLNQYSQSAAQPGLAVEKIQNLFIPVPSIEEQNSISAHIEAETQKLDATISKIEKEIELLQEYRTALISEVVTGKICVL